MELRSSEILLPGFGVLISEAEHLEGDKYKATISLRSSSAKPPICFYEEIQEPYHWAGKWQKPPLTTAHISLLFVTRSVAKFLSSMDQDDRQNLYAQCDRIVKRNAEDSIARSLWIRAIRSIRPGTNSERVLNAIIGFLKNCKEALIEESTYVNEIHEILRAAGQREIALDECLEVELKVLVDKYDIKRVRRILRRL